MKYQVLFFFSNGAMRSTVVDETCDQAYNVRGRGTEAAAGSLLRNAEGHAAAMQIWWRPTNDTVDNLNIHYHHESLAVQHDRTFERAAHSTITSTDPITAQPAPCHVGPLVLVSLASFVVPPLSVETGGLGIGLTLTR